MTYPTANATGVSTAQPFQWTTVSGADAYILHIGTAPNTWNVLAAGLLTQPSYLVVTTLPTDVTLYVRVGSRVGGIWRYSASIPFTALRMTATLIYPAANATGVVTTQAFTWTGVPGADAYILHIGTAPNTWNVLAAGLLTDPSHLVTVGLPGGTLYARVGARVGGVWRWGTHVPFTAASSLDQPRFVLFTASPHHSTLVTRYELEIFTAGQNPATATPLTLSDLGKPAPDASNEIAVDRGAFFGALSPGSYIATVKALGTQGWSRSGAVPFTAAP
jgi:hypothetical protein